MERGREGVRGRLLLTLRVAPPMSPGKVTKVPTLQQGNPDTWRREQSS